MTTQQLIRKAEAMQDAALKELDAAIAEPERWPGIVAAYARYDRKQAEANAIFDEAQTMQDRGGE